MPYPDGTPYWRDRYPYYVSYQILQTFTVGVNAESEEEALKLYAFVEQDYSKPSTIHVSNPIQLHTIAESNKEYNDRWGRMKGKMDGYGYE